MNRYRQEATPQTLPLVLLLMLAFLLVFGRLVQMQLLEGSKWVTLAQKQRNTSTEIQDARGDIVDRRGRPLAVSVEAVSVGLQPARLQKKDKTLPKLAEILELDLPKLKQSAHSRDSFFWLARGKDRFSGQKVRALRNPGLVVDSLFRRVYPQGQLAASILGRICRDGKGQSGIEHAMNNELSAGSRAMPLRRDGRMQLVAISSQPDAVLRGEGQRVQLTIDAVLQSIVEKEIARGRIAAKARNVDALVMDADSGEILAMAQTGNFNPNQLENVNPSELRNRLLQDNYEPGSTFKPLVAALALDSGLLDANEKLDCENGNYRVGKHTIRDVHPQEILPVSEVLVRSSNICMVKIAERLKTKRMQEGLKRYGFGQATGIRLPGEAKGILRSKWRTIDQATASFGQGVAVTSLQLVRAYAALANGGFLVEPHIVSRIKPQTSKRILKSETAHTVAEMLTGVTSTEQGTGKKAAIAGLRVSGKTGTAQKAKKSGRGYEPDKVLSSFIGFVDVRPLGLDRRLVMLVSVDEPGVKPRWGGVVAAPVFRASMERIVTHLLASEARGLKTASAKRSNRHLS